MSADAGPVVVEPARRRDVLPILALYREILAEGRGFVSRPEELRLTVGSLEAFVDTTRASLSEALLVARTPSARVAGVLRVEVVPLVRLRHVGRLELLVGAAHRRQGLGAALLDAAIERAESTRALRKLSLAVFADNLPAIALYRSRGFVEEGRRLGEVLMDDGTERDDLLMARRLAAP